MHGISSLGTAAQLSSVKGAFIQWHLFWDTDHDG
jgi:hypothetical protein